MSESSVKQPSKRILVEMTEDLIREIDEWRRRQPELVPRSTAIRSLILIGLLRREA